MNQNDKKTSNINDENDFSKILSNENIIKKLNDFDINMQDLK